MNLLSPVAKKSQYTLYHGDSVLLAELVPDNSVHFSLYSPPFSKLFCYSNSDHDLGNCRTNDEFLTHFGFLAKHLYRVLMPGRLMAVHCMDMPLVKERDGVIGFSDFSGDLIRLFQSHGFIMHGPRITIWKDPLIEATRTKALGLMHKQLCKDSAMCRTCSPDYLLVMRKPGDNKEPVTRPEGMVDYVGENQIDGTPGYFPPMGSTEPCYSHNAWRGYASPVWMDINQTRTLNYRDARDPNDEAHVCPLQLDVIERAIHLWTNPGDTVFSPFAGIGSEVYGAVINGRKGIGIELKPSYYRQAVKTLEEAVKDKPQEVDLFA